MSQRSKKTYDDVRAAFETGRIVRCSATELTQFLLAADCEKISEPAEQARASAMRQTIRHLLAAKHNRELQHRSSRWTMVAALLAAAALLWLGGRAYYDWRADRMKADTFESERLSALRSSGTGGDPRTHFTLAELAHRAPSMRSGTLQAWWAGEQARQVLRYEAQAKRKALAGDTQGAVRSVQRADEIRSGIRGLREPEATEIIVSTQWRGADEKTKDASR